MVWILSGLFRRRPLDMAARRLYHATVAQARQPGFFLNWGVPDSAIGRFDMIVLHGFLILRRLREDSGAEAFGEAYCSAIFEDMDRNLREMGIGDLSVGRKVRKLAEGFYGRIAAYDRAVGETSDDALSATIQRNLYGGDDPGAPVLAAMAGYVRRSIVVLAAQETRDLLAGRAQFAPPPEKPSNDRAIDRAEDQTGERT